MGKDVESIIRDLVETAVKQYREQEIAKVEQRALDAAEERILDALLTPARGSEAETRVRFQKLDKCFARNSEKAY